MTRARRAGPRAVFGMGVASTLALALLALGCVFAATAGPREALATRTQALRQTLAATSPLARAISVSGTWNTVASALGQASPSPRPAINLTEDQFGEITSQLNGDFSHGIVRLAPLSQDWASMVSKPHALTTVLPATDGVPVDLEVGYREPFSQYVRLVDGSYPAPPAPLPASAPPGSAVQNLQVLVSQQTARQFGLHPGSKLTVTGPQLALTGKQAGIVLDVTGIVAPRDPGSTFWAADPTAVAPSLQAPQNAPPFWVGEVLAGPGAGDAVQRDFGPTGLDFTWELPFEVSYLTGDQAASLYDALTQVAAQSPALTGDVAPVSSTVVASIGLLQSLNAFIATGQAVDSLLWLLYVSLAAAGIVTLVLAARMVTMRRTAELAMRRARGASLRQIAWTAAGGAAIACVPAAVVAAVIAVAWIPGPLPPGGWWPGAVTLAVAVCAPAALAVWQQRLPRHRARDRTWGLTRLVAEVTACLAAIAGVIVFRHQGAQAGAGVNLYTSAAPVLIAVPAVIVVLRLYPLVLRGLLRGSSRSTGATAFLGLARAARTRLTPALPAFALVLALTVAAFAGMVRDAVTTGEVAASWQTAGADVSLAMVGGTSTGEVVTPATLREAAAVPGVTHAVAVWQFPWTAPDGQQVTGLAVDPAQYAALVADTQTFPRVQAGQLTRGTAGSPQPVLASAQTVAAIGGSGTGTLTAHGLAPLRVRIAGVLSGTPALPAGGAFVIMPVAAIHGQVASGPTPYNELLITGTNIDSARMAAVLRDRLPGAVATYRSDILKSLSGAPLQHGTFDLFALALVAAAVLGLAVMLFELALGAAERETTLGRLAAMGLSEGQRVRLVVLEVLPAVIAAAVAAAACALVLPRLVAPSLDLSVFTGSAASVALAPDVGSLAVPLGGLVVASLVALGVEIRSARRRGVAASVRAGE